MPFLREAELQPVKGMNFSVPSTYLPKGYVFPQNFQYMKGELLKRPGKTPLGGVSLGAKSVLHLGIFELSSSTVKLVRHTKSNVQVFNTTSGEWDDFTGTDLSGTDLDYYDNTVVTELDMYIFVNNIINNPRKMLDATNSADLGGSPPKARCCEYMTPYLLLGNVESGGNKYPYQLNWCDTGDPETWVGGNAGGVLLSDEPSGIRRIKKLKNYAMVYKEKSIYRGYQVGAPDIFDFACLGLGKGIYAPRVIADDGNYHYYMGLQDFYRNDGIRSESIGKSINEYIFNRINRAVNESCHAIHVEQYKEIWFVIATTGFTTPNEVWKYNYDLDFWYFDTIKNALSSNMYKRTGFTSWNQLIGTWDQQIGAWDKQAGVTNAPFPVFGFDTGLVGKLDENVVDDFEVAVETHLDTKDYSGLVVGGIERDTRFLQVDFFGRGDSVRLYYSLDQGTSWNFVAENELGSIVDKSTFYIDIIAKHIRFRFEQRDKGRKLTMRSLQIYFLDGGEIVS
jgi:hypothetical protein